MKRLTILALLLISCAFRSHAQNVKVEFEPDIVYDYYDAYGNYHSAWSWFNIKYDTYDQQRSWMENPKPRFNIYLMPVGIMFQGKQTEPSLALDLGVRMTRHFYIGAETGVNFRTYGNVTSVGTPKYSGTYVPLALNVKGLIPIGKNICPYISASAGGYFGIQRLEGTNGFYSSLRAGLEFNRFNLAAGYSLIKLPSSFSGNFQMTFGFRIGR